jgi:hypothetical protein
MIKELTLAEACDSIENFALANGLDSLSAVESMVKHYKLLSAREQQALTVFMNETAKVDDKIIKMYNVV